MSEKLYLKWTDYRENVNSAFGSLREDNDFADMTLSCEDGQQIEAHKVILVALSPFFQNLLKRNKHPYPLIYMKGVKLEILLAGPDLLWGFMEHAAKLSKHVVDNGSNFDFNEIDLKRRKNKNIFI